MFPQRPTFAGVFPRQSRSKAHFPAAEAGLEQTHLSPELPKPVRTSPASKRRRFPVTGSGPLGAPGPAQPRTPDLWHTHTALGALPSQRQPAGSGITKSGRLPPVFDSRAGGQPGVPPAAPPAPGYVGHQQERNVLEITRPGKISSKSISSEQNDLFLI